ncbi:MAG: hypothetical protein B6D41_01510 [Chloroflexi bacterium UTCFX4]|jgi:hypothetical protein|nr:MAG: hypothetical protein B6D41_01510 [Chloroflexi bacterium UTCFX4]
MNCPNCGFQNREDAKFCSNCGRALGGILPAQAAQAPYPNMAMQPAAPTIPSYPAAASKSKSTALILEILPGLFGFLGFGWIYVGETQRGVLTLIGYIVLAIVSMLAIAVTAGFGCFICVPLLWGAIAYSAYQLNLYTKARPDLYT